MKDVPDINTEGWTSESAADTASRLPVVLQVLPSLEVGGGGVERSAIDVAEALALAGKKTIVASAGGRHVVDLERRGAIHVSLPLAAKSPDRKSTRLNSSH